MNNVGGLQLYLKRDSGTGVSCKFSRIFKNTFFHRKPTDDYFFIVELVVKIVTTYANGRRGSYYSRSSHSEMFFKIAALKNFKKFTGKYMCRSFFLIKLQACKFIKKETLAQLGSCEFCENFENAFFIEHLRWLLLLFVTLIFTYYLQNKISSCYWIVDKDCYGRSWKVENSGSKLSILCT